MDSHPHEDEAACGPECRCRYCRHPLTDDQERSWGICGVCYDDGQRESAAT